MKILLFLGLKLAEIAFFVGLFWGGSRFVAWLEREHETIFTVFGSIFVGTIILLILIMVCMMNWEMAGEIINKIRR